MQIKLWRLLELEIRQSKCLSSCHRVFK